MTDRVSTVEVLARRRSDETRAFVRQVKRVTRRKFTPEEKVRVLPEGFRSELRVSELCLQKHRRKGSGGPDGIRTHDSRIKKSGGLPLS